MLITDFPQFLPGRYGRIGPLRRELMLFANHAGTYGDAYLTDWLTSAVEEMKTHMPNGTDTNEES